MFLAIFQKGVYCLAAISRGILTHRIHLVGQGVSQLPYFLIISKILSIVPNCADAVYGAVISLEMFFHVILVVTLRYLFDNGSEVGGHGTLLGTLENVSFLQEFPQCGGYGEENDDDEIDLYDAVGSPRVSVRNCGALHHVHNVDICVQYLLPLILYASESTRLTTLTMANGLISSNVIM